jgi:tetratricopeptide (TPR) repeat protein
MRTLLLVLAVFLAPAALAQPAAPDAPPDAYGEAEAHLEAGTDADLRAAVRLYRQAIAQDSAFAPAYLGLGRAYDDGVWNHDWDRALLDSVYWAGWQAVHHDPHFTDAYEWLAFVYRSEINHSMTRQLLASGVAHNPDAPTLLTLLGRNYFDTGDCGMARPFLERALELGPVPLTYRYLGWCHFYLRQPEPQEEYFRQYIELEPTNDQGLGGYVWAYTLQGRHDEAIAVAQDILDRNEGHPRYHRNLLTNLAEAHLFAGRDAEAQRLYEEVLANVDVGINQFSARVATTTLGHLYWQAGRRDEARALLQRSLDHERANIAKVAADTGIEIPERWEFAYGIASAHAAQEEFGEAYRWLFRAVMAGYPGHMAFTDPVLAGMYDDPAYRLLMRRAQMRIESTWAAAEGLTPADLRD